MPKTEHLRAGFFAGILIVHVIQTRTGPSANLFGIGSNERKFAAW
ncbi:MAG: hypothetical protein ACTS73_06250 [Arsenophonus sp. NEOnobi-MAG3]